MAPKQGNNPNFKFIFRSDVETPTEEISNIFDSDPNPTFEEGIIRPPIAKFIPNLKIRDGKEKHASQKTEC